MKIYNLAFLWYIPIISGFLFLYPPASLTTDGKPKFKNKLGPANVVFKSSDGGQTWQDISAGLPENWQRGDFFANDSGLYVTVGNYICHSKPNSYTPFWEKKIFPVKHSSLAPRKYDTFKTAKGTFIIGSYQGLFISTNSGKTYKQVYAGGSVMKVVESNGVLIATGQGGILRSTDDGETWDRVISERGVTSIIQTGEYFFCSRVTGIYRSSDKGKTWKLLLPSIKDMVFNLFVSGNVIYAIPTTNGGC